MNEQNKKNQYNSYGTTLRFTCFWQFIAKNLGDSRLLIRHKANSIETFLAPNSDHREFLRDVIVTSYFECNCCSIEDTIDINTILDVMGEAAYELQGRNKDDLMDIELLEEIAYLIRQHYFYLIDMPTLVESKSPDDNIAAIVDFSSKKIRRANAKLM